MAITVIGTLAHGYTDAQGVTHVEFEMRAPTIGDLEAAAATAPQDCSSLVMSRHIWARTITRLGTLPPGAVTPELLAGLHYSELGVLQNAEDAVTKKFTPASANSEPSGS